MVVQQGSIYGYSASFDYNCPVCGAIYDLGIPLEHTGSLGCPNKCGARFIFQFRVGTPPCLVCVA